MNTQCVVVIPIYKSLNIDDIMVIKQACMMTPTFKKVFIAPQSFQLDDSFREFEEIETLHFEDQYFVSIQGYNLLMLSLEFYKAFVNYEYILIHQTDAYLFKDELEHWCNEGYDYIGAPWTFRNRQKKYYWYQFKFKYCKSFFNREKLVRQRTYNNVGNGGLSLRKVSTFIDVLSEVDPDLLKMYEDNTSPYYNEDVFWSVEVPEFYNGYKKPKQKKAIYFALENESKRMYKKMGNKLPFGCHDFKSLQPVFWKQFIPYKLDKK